ncbi:MAG: hypothetical protein UR28_C0001G0020 [Candidatus Peregrinibacteria bacterium GW2011_GWF2_33_10]|nr:MAG: hypothetical protein UR28_C0001G0020 [Candidatus Peregrinibacteria bacterium GW2011_GWF2_33_10]OGJ44024.1 MAG: hypothetical protein A2263_01420 [Candidatus Peregrinibacteria bacterium RIFOXYA2_FULL_33_21]OGJ47187.1 MAG: hypothetical protein A2272_05920 [Candidatus Peregrinibacteria bacterium RIFOXYA12_FULL_33_12]OGJ49921.1 MAG: hypothetical protein A2307_00930 [Candidatus Peregrinibacteria bacterium RIFOXYB2_FULL_33_20]
MSTCPQCQKPFEIRPQDIEFYAKFNVPSPTLCQYCRLQNRLNFRNERTLYNRQSDFTGRNIISIYTPNNRYKVYTTDEWWGDKWDGLEYGQEYNFSKPFFEQFQELLLKVPRITLFNVNPYNSDYCQQAYNNKNCYLCTVVTQCEDSMYLAHTNKADNSYDCSYTQNIQLCYDCLDSDKLYECISCQSCQNSNDLIFCYDCIGCKNCFGCAGLRNKEFYIFNKKYSKEEYQDKVESLELFKYSNFIKYKNYFHDIAKQAIQRADRNLNTEDSLGNYLINAKNCYQCFDSFEIQDCSYCTWIFNSSDCHDIYGLGGGKFAYESVGVENVNFCAFNTFVSDSNDVFYSDCCFYSSNLFGCSGLKNKKYCILNKQYTKEEYEILVAKIIEHMKNSDEFGKFFPTSLSPFAYNESIAPFYFPLSKDTAITKGYKWKDDNKKEYQKQNFEIPDSIEDVDNQITNKILACIDCNKNYKIMLTELSFYKKMDLPIPRKCTDCRYKNQMNLRNPIYILDRKCEKCNTEIKTTYTEELAPFIYCQKCYSETVD